ncbi:MAG TPA: MraZ N-terminal domain-containing protein [Acetobacteraceae bacterium]|nr:MraZ N-terminal domain-containing protein [Acetobacteraceae bacterium]
MSHEFVLAKVAENGRLSLPARYRKLLGLEDGGLVVVRLEDGALRIQPIRAVIAELQAAVHRDAADTESGVDWLINERRREAAREERKEEESSTGGHSGCERNHSADR